MAWTQDEINYLRENSQVFDSANLSMILNHLDQAVISEGITRRMANKMAFFSALAIDKESILLVVENRGSSRSSRRADAGQKIMRIHYGVKADGLKPSGDDKKPIIHIPQRVRSPKVAVNMYEFTYFKGTLSPKHLKQLMFNPLVSYNSSNFGRREADLVTDIINKVDWDSIDEE